MTRTFLVALTLDDSSDLATLAGDLSDDITAAGWEVESVKPWNASIVAPQLISPVGPAPIAPG